MHQHIKNYVEKLTAVINSPAMEGIHQMVDAMQTAWREGKTIYLCGNGGSAGNASHLANDFLYGAGINHGVGLKVEALSANAAVLTCLANDIGYDKIYSEQLRVKANSGDVLVALSGSGNSPNIVKALEIGREKGMHTFAILGFTGGKCKELAMHPIHFDIHDMQISEDMQMIVGHICMQWLCNHPYSKKV